MHVSARKTEGLPRNRVQNAVTPACPRCGLAAGGHRHQAADGGPHRAVQAQAALRLARHAGAQGRLRPVVCKPYSRLARRLPLPFFLWMAFDPRLLAGAIISLVLGYQAYQRSPARVSLIEWVRLSKEHPRTGRGVAWRAPRTRACGAWRGVAVQSSSCASAQRSVLHKKQQLRSTSASRLTSESHVLVYLKVHRGGRSKNGRACATPKCILSRTNSRSSNVTSFKPKMNGQPQLCSRRGATRT